METTSGRLNQENYDTGCDAYDAHVSSEKSYNALAETPYMHQLLQSLRGKRILDFCCGTGRYTNWLAERFPETEVIGVDFSEQSVQVAMQKATAKNLTNVCYHTGSIEMIEGKYPQYFNGVAWGMGLNYFQDLDVVFDGLQSCLKSQGWLVCSFLHPLACAGEGIHSETGQYGRSVFHYFNTEMQTFEWQNVTRNDGKPFVTRNYPYSFEALTTALSKNNFYLERILEPQPISEGKELEPNLYYRLSCCPQFAIIQAVKKN